MKGEFNLETIYKCMHHIDLDDEKIIEVPIVGESAESFISNVISDTIRNEKTRKYTKKSDTTEVIGLINKLIVNDLDVDRSDCGNGEVAVAFDIKDTTERISMRLLEHELLAQQKIEPMGKKIKKGSLIQLFAKQEEQYIYTLIKIDHSAYLDLTRMENSVGLPLEEKILKSCVIEYNENNEIENIKIYDSTKKIADYWWSGLLELKYNNSDNKNTRNAMRKIRACIEQNLSNEAPLDSTLIKNKMVGYFTSNSQFDIDEFCTKVIDEYNPKKENLDKQSLKNKIQTLAVDKFDSQFNIDSSVVEKDKVEVYKIGDRISLTLYDEIENLTDKIMVCQENGHKVLKLVDIPEDIYLKFKN